MPTATNIEGAFLGFVSLLLAGFGLASQLRRSWFWAVLGLIFLILALGPILQTQFCYDLHQQSSSYICYDQTPHQQVQGITLPGQLISSLPFGNIARVPLRFVLLVMLSLAMLAAFGLAKAATMWPFQANWQRLALPVCAGLLVFVEFLPIPRVLQIPAFHLFILKSKMKVTGTILRCWKRLIKFQLSPSIIRPCIITRY